MTDDALLRFDAVIQVAMRIARSAPTGKIALARLARSLDSAWIPMPEGDAIAAELEEARNAASAPVDFKRVERVLRDAWGAAPADELDDLEREPVAVTPIAQVHRGVLDGSDVAVKVIRPGLASSVRQDLALLEGLLAPLGAAFPAVDAGAILREVREGVLDELDLENEAVAQRRFHRALRSHPVLTVPAPITRLAHEHVLVSEWVDGTPLSEAADRDAASAQLVLFAIGAARSGMIHADLDPDDVLLVPDGRIAILDFGATRTVDPARVAAACDLVEAFVREDDEALGESLRVLGWLEPAHAATASQLVRDTLAQFASPDPVRLDAEAVIAAGGRLLRRREAVSELLLAGALPPEDVWPARGVAQLFGTIARVGATAPWRELTRAALREGWDARPD